MNKKPVLIGGVIAFIDFLLISITTMFGIDAMRQLNWPFLFVAQQLFNLTNCTGEGCWFFGWLVEFFILMLIGCLFGVLASLYLKGKNQKRYGTGDGL